MIRQEDIHAGFAKYHLNSEGEEGWPFRPVLHRFTQAEPDHWDPHDHPWDFTTTVIRGWYVEEVYLSSIKDPRGYTTMRVKRGEGSHVKQPNFHVHRIVEVSPGECWTVCQYGPWLRDARFYRYLPGGAVLTRSHDGRFER